MQSSIKLVLYLTQVLFDLNELSLLELSYDREILLGIPKMYSSTHFCHEKLKRAICRSESWSSQVFILKSTEISYSGYHIAPVYDCVFVATKWCCQCVFVEMHVKLHIVWVEERPSAWTSVPIGVCGRNQLFLLVFRLPMRLQRLPIDRTKILHKLCITINHRVARHSWYWKWQSSLLKSLQR